MIDESALLANLHRRDPAAFTQLFEEYADKLFRLAAGLLRNDAEAEGVVQETFLRLFTNLDQFEGRAALGTWLYRIAYNLAIDTVRRRRPQLALDDDTPIAPTLLADWGQRPEDLLAQSEETAVLQQAIDALPETLRAVFLLREVEGLSTAETARVVGLTPANTKVRLHRARLLLREQLAEAFTAA